MKKIILILLISFQIQALSFKDSFSLKKLFSNSTHVVLAKVTDLEPYKKGRSIHTIFEFAVTKSFKGDLRSYDKFEISLFGGKLGKIVSIRPGAPYFKNNEKVFLFLKLANDKFTLPFGKSSKIKITPDFSYYDETNRKSLSKIEFEKTLHKLGDERWKNSF